MNQGVPEPAGRVFHRDQVTWVMYALLGYYAFMLNALGPVMPFLQMELSLSYTLLSLHASSFAAGMLIAGFTGDRLVRRFSRLGVLWIGGVGLSGASLLLLLSHHPLLSLPSVLLMGTLGSLLLVVIPAVLADRHGEQRVIALTEANVSASITSTLAPLLVGVFVQQQVGWRAALLVSVGMFGVLAVWLRRFSSLGGASPADAQPKVRGVLAPAYWGYWIVLVLAVGIEFCMVLWAAAFLVETDQLSPAHAALALTLFLGLMVVGRWLGATLATRVSSNLLLRGALCFTLSGFLLFWLAPGILVTLFGLALTGLGVANLYPLTLAGAVGTSPLYADIASAKALLASGLAILSAPLLLGALSDTVGLWRAYAIVPVMILTATAILEGVQRRRIVTCPAGSGGAG